MRDCIKILSDIDFKNLYKANLVENAKSLNVLRNSVISRRISYIKVINAIKDSYNHSSYIDKIITLNESANNLSADNIILLKNQILLSKDFNSYINFIKNIEKYFPLYAYDPRPLDESKL